MRILLLESSGKGRDMEADLYFDNEIELSDEGQVVRRQTRKPSGEYGRLRGGGH